MPWPSAGPAGDRVAGPSSVPSARAPRHRPGRQPCQPDAPAHRFAAPRWMQASQASGAGRPVRHAIARQWPDTPDRRCASPRCAVSPERSSISGEPLGSTPTAPVGGRSPALRDPAHAGSQAPPAPQTTGIAQKAASLIVQTSLVPCRRPSGTIVFRQPAAHRPQQPHPHWTSLSRPPPRTAAAPPVPQPADGLATPTYPAAPDPNVADPPSRHPPSRRCDDYLIPPWDPWSE